MLGCSLFVSFLATVKITLLVCWAKSYFPGPVLFWIYMKKHSLQTKNLILCFYNLKRTSMQIMKACGETPASVLIIISTLVLLQPHKGWDFLFFFFFHYLRYALVNDWFMLYSVHLLSYRCKLEIAKHERNVIVARGNRQVYSSFLGA